MIKIIIDKLNKPKIIKKFPIELIIESLLKPSTKIAPNISDIKPVEKINIIKLSK